MTMDKEAFTGESIFSVSSDRLAGLRARVGQLQDHDIKAENIENTKRKLLNEFGIGIGAVDQDDIKIYEEVDRGQQSQQSYRRVLPTNIEAIYAVFKLPISGSEVFFTYCPSSRINIGNAFVKANAIHFKYLIGEHDPQRTKTEFERHLEQFKQNLDLLVNECNAFNASLIGQVNSLLDNRIEAIKKKDDFIDGLGYPREDQ